MAIQFTWDERTFTAIYDPAKHRTPADAVAKALSLRLCAHVTLLDTARGEYDALYYDARKQVDRRDVVRIPSEVVT